VFPQSSKPCFLLSADYIYIKEVFNVNRREVFIMQKLFKCKYIGNDCNYEVQGKSEEEILQKVSDHAKTVHHMNEISKEFSDKVRAEIYTWF